MNLAKMWRKRRWYVEELLDRLDRLQDTINNRNDLIRVQDEEITRLRTSLRLLQNAVDDIEALRQAAVERFEQLEKDRDYWQGKAANP